MTERVLFYIRRGVGPVEHASDQEILDAADAIRSAPSLTCKHWFDAPRYQQVDQIEQGYCDFCEHPQDGIGYKPHRQSKKCCCIKCVAGRKKPNEVDSNG